MTSEFAGGAERKKHLIPRALSVLNAETSGKRLFTSRANKRRRKEKTVKAVPFKINGKGNYTFEESIKYS